MKNIYTICLMVYLGFTSLSAQSSQPDSVVINVGNASKITFVIRDRKDLETLKSYNFQSLMDDLIAKLEAKDTTSGMKTSDTYLKESDQSTTNTSKKEDEDENWKKSDNDESWKNDKDDVTIDDKKFYRGTRHSLSFDFGTNNYLSGDGTFPDAGTDLYTVRPWGSWYGAINSVYRTRLSRVFFLEWGIGASMYNFKFQNDAVTIGPDPTTVTYTVDTRPVDFIKSKLSATYVN